jgi:hypothetical protein
MVVPNIGKERVIQKMRYEDARKSMEPLCDHCREKLSNIILPQGSGQKRVFRMGEELYRVEMIT